MLDTPPEEDLSLIFAMRFGDFLDDWMVEPHRSSQWSPRLTISSLCLGLILFIGDGLEHDVPRGKSRCPGRS